MNEPLSLEQIWNRLLGQRVLVGYRSGANTEIILQGTLIAVTTIWLVFESLDSKNNIFLINVNATIHLTEVK